MTAPAIATGTLSGFSGMDNDQFMRDVLGETPASESPPPKPDAAPEAKEAPAITTPAPKAGVSVSAEPEVAADGDVEEVELTPEQADAERIAAKWTRNEVTGQWRKPDGQFAKLDELPPAEREIEAPKPKRELLAKYEIKRKGAVVDPLEVADDEVTYTANGKTVTRTFDHAMKMAQMGEHNEQREIEYRATQAKAVEAQAKIATVTSANRKLRDFVESILEDTDEANEMIYRARERRASANSPEARARALDQREREFNERTQNAQAEAQNTATTARIGTLMSGLEQKYPDVEKETIYGKYALLWNEHAASADANDLSRFEAAITSSLVPWLEQLHEQRQSKSSSERAAAQLEIDKAKAESVKAKRIISRRLKPSTNGQLSHTKQKSPVTSVKQYMLDEYGKDE
jgi:hypothetical protein